jgi:hypothetical protein
VFERGRNLAQLSDYKIFMEDIPGAAGYETKRMVSVIQAQTWL